MLMADQARSLLWIRRFGGWNDRAVIRFPASALHDEWHVNLIGLVVQAQRIHDQVHAETKCKLALALSARFALQVVVAEIVAGPRAAEVVGDVHADQPAVARDAFHRRSDQ